MIRMSHHLSRSTAAALALLILTPVANAQRAEPADSSFWLGRDTVLARDGGATVRIAVWDSGVDTLLFASQLARDAQGRVLLRGYDQFKRRQDTPLAVLPAALAARADELNRSLQAYDDIESGVQSALATQMLERERAMSETALRAFDDALSDWSGYAHGTAVADIALAGHGRAQMVIARMEWWHGSPPVPCWSRELAVREAESVGDLLAFVVASGARVVNMSWNRAERSYLSNLEQCAPARPVAERLALARFTVDTIRAVLQSGMRAAPQVLFVGAAGNAGTSVEEANPATRFSLPNFLLVGAVNHRGERSRYTNHGPEVTLFANGDRVPARLPGGALSYPSGTSMAAPNVSNAAAKMLAVNPSLSGAELRSLLEQTGDLNSSGDRLLFTSRAVRAAQAATRKP